MILVFKIHTLVYSPFFRFSFPRKIFITTIDGGRESPLKFISRKYHVIVWKSFARQSPGKLCFSNKNKEEAEKRH